MHRTRTLTLVALSAVTTLGALSAPAAGMAATAGKSPLAFRDSDHDGMPDSWEKAHGLNPRRKDASADPDRDGLSNLREYRLGTNPRRADTDRDGMPDGWEVADGLNPRANDANGDPDHDELTNRQEYRLHTKPRSADSDHDGTPDGQENSGTVASYDADTGMLTVTTPAGQPQTVTVTGATEIKWDDDRAGCADHASTADLTPGRLIHEIGTTEEGGSPSAPAAHEITLICG